MSLEKLRTYLWVAFATTLNIIANALSVGGFLWLEGRTNWKGLWWNWAKRFPSGPLKQPNSEEELKILLLSSKNVRVVGSGHSFNAAVVVPAQGVLINLDRISGVVPDSWDLEKKQVTVRGGTRVRSVVSLLAERGWAFAALPSHDAQSIAGIISTDVHGTGKSWGFVSESVVSISVMIADGTIKEYIKGRDEEFWGVIGGIGAAGIITRVRIQAIEQFRVRQHMFLEPSFKDLDVDALFAQHDHVSLYVFPFTDYFQVSAWDRVPVETKYSTFAGLREWFSISLDSFLVSWIGNLVSYLKLMPWLSPLLHRAKFPTNFVMDSAPAFNRTIYPLHQELEFSVPFSMTKETIEKFKELYENMYWQDSLPYMLLEVRFTPAKATNAWIGAGYGEEKRTWIDLIVSDSAGFERYYAESERLLMELKARPHLGKFCNALTADYMEVIFGARLEKFRDLMKRNDPDGKFRNAFIQRLLAP